MSYPHLEIVEAITSDPDACIASFESELEKISFSLGGIGARAGKATGGFFQNLVGGVGRGIGAGAEALSGGLNRGVNAVSGLAENVAGKVKRVGPAVSDAYDTVRSARAGLPIEQMRVLDAEAAALRQQQAAAAAASRQQDNLNAYRQRIGLGAAPDAAGAIPGAAGAAPGAGQFMDQHFGANLLNQQGGLQNWWQQATGAQKMKTLGALGGGLMAANMANNAVTGGPTVNRYG